MVNSLLKPCMHVAGIHLFQEGVSNIGAAEYVSLIPTFVPLSEAV